MVKTIKLVESSTKLWCVRLYSGLRQPERGQRYSLETQSQQNSKNNLSEDKDFFSLYLHVSDWSGRCPLPTQIGFFAKSLDDALKFTENKHNFYLNKLKTAYDTYANNADHPQVVLDGFFQEAREEYLKMLEKRKE